MAEFQLDPNQTNQCKKQNLSSYPWTLGAQWLHKVDAEQIINK